MASFFKTATPRLVLQLYIFNYFKCMFLKGILLTDFAIPINKKTFLTKK